MMTLLCKVELSEDKGPDLKRSEGDILFEFFVEDLVLACQVDHFVPIPLVLNELAVLHITPQRGLTHRAKGDCSGIVSCQYGRYLVSKQAHCHRRRVIEVMDTYYCPVVIERPHRKLQVIYIADSIPFISLLDINLSRLHSLAWTDLIALNKQRLIILSLYVSLIIVFVLNCDGMSVLLILTPVCTLVNPFPIIFGQPIEIDPDGTRAISSGSLWPV